MKTVEANNKLDEILLKIEKNSNSLNDIVEDIRELREISLKEQDPLITKVLRLICEYIILNDIFDVDIQSDENEIENEFDTENSEDNENLIYLLSLIKKSENKINREEIKDFRTALKERLY
jgi:hypothetical protein